MTHVVFFLVSFDRFKIKKYFVILGAGVLFIVRKFIQWSMIVIWSFCLLIYLFTSIYLFLQRSIKQIGDFREYFLLFHARMSLCCHLHSQLEEPHESRNKELRYLSGHIWPTDFQNDPLNLALICPDCSLTHTPCIPNPRLFT